jgi:hypothetical protein
VKDFEQARLYDAVLLVMEKNKQEEETASYKKSSLDPRFKRTEAYKKWKRGRVNV